MSRPEYLNCIMTPEVIRGIRERQELYDKDPEAYERKEKQREIEREEEKHQEEMERQRQ